MTPALLEMSGGSSGAAETTRVRMALVVPPALVAEMATFVCPDAVGVPEITPVAAFAVRPGGRFVALKAVGEFVAVIV